MSEKKEDGASSVSLLGQELMQVLRKQDEAVLSSNALELEDDFQDLYGDSAGTEGVALTPPFDPKKLLYLVSHNNTLLQCVSAMEVNIDGTGYDVVSKDEEDLDEGERQRLLDFLGEVYPGTTFTELRREVRRDKESIGYGFVEVIRNLAGDIVFLKRIPAKTMRMLRLDEPTTVKKSITRGSETVEVDISVRERRFVQKVAEKTVYFREYGSSRHIDRRTGRWDEDGNLAPAKRGNEVLMLGVIEDHDGPYFIPRWVNQMPTVLGSRKAEEFNLDYFNAGGIPPVLVMIMNGMLTPESRKTFQKLFSGSPQDSNRGALVEVQGTGGSTDSEPKVGVQVERFASEQQKDHMFSGYDEKSSEKVRQAFRLAPIFLGRTAEYNFATAVTAYLVTEAQLFRPERDEFDNVFNMTVMRELSEAARLKSNPLTLSDATMQLKALGMVSKHITPEELLKQVERITDMSVELAEEGEPRAEASGAAPQNEDGKGSPEDDLRKSDVRVGPEEMIDLVRDWRTLINSPEQVSEDHERMIMKRIQSLSKNDRSNLNRMFSMSVMSNQENDPEGTAALCGCAGEYLHGLHRHG